MIHAGKHALITGGGTGIGLAMAQSLVAQGAQVTITGRRQEVLDAVATKGMTGVAMDVREESQVVDTIQAAVEARGPDPDLHRQCRRCHRQGRAQNGHGLLARHDGDEPRRGLSDHPRKPWLHAPNRLGPRDRSLLNRRNSRGVPGAACYSASKHGMIGLIRSLSEDYMGTPFTFNSICPGYVDTEIITRNTESISKRAGISAEDAKNIMVKTNRHKRLVEVDEVARRNELPCRSRLAKHQRPEHRNCRRANVNHPSDRAR